MNSKLLTLYKTVDQNGFEEYIVSDVMPIDAIPLAYYNNINELVQMGGTAVGSSTFYTSGTPVTYTTKALTAEGRERISESSKRQAGSGNSQYGTRWIHSLIKKKSKKIRATDPLPVNWIEGRKIKFIDVGGEVTPETLKKLKKAFKKTFKKD